MKRCTKCKVMKSLDEFYKDRWAGDGLCRQCKECRQAYYREKHPGAKQQQLTYNQTHRTIGDISQRLCIHCSVWKPIDVFCKDRSRKDGLCGWCKACRRAYQQSSTGKAVRVRYQQSPEGRDCRRTYRRSPKGKAVGARATKKYRGTKKGKAVHVKACEKYQAGHKKQ